MTKAGYTTKHGLTLRKVTMQDRQSAKTDYQRQAEYIISDGKCEYFSMKAQKQPK